LSNYFSPDCFVLFKVHFNMIRPSTVGVLNGLFLSIGILFSFHFLAQGQENFLEFVSRRAWSSSVVNCIGVLVYTPVCIPSVETQQCFG
jgi:hypothetical protein